MKWLLCLKPIVTFSTSRLCSLVGYLCELPESDSCLWTDLRRPPFRLDRTDSHHLHRSSQFRFRDSFHGVGPHLLHTVGRETSDRCRTYYLMLGLWLASWLVSCCQICRQVSTGDGCWGWDQCQLRGWPWALGLGPFSSLSHPAGWSCNGDRLNARKWIWKNGMDE